MHIVGWFDDTLGQHAIQLTMQRESLENALYKLDCHLLIL